MGERELLGSLLLGGADRDPHPALVLVPGTGRPCARRGEGAPRRRLRGDAVPPSPGAPALVSGGAAAPPPATAARVRDAPRGPVGARPSRLPRTARAPRFDRPDPVRCSAVRLRPPRPRGVRDGGRHVSRLPCRVRVTAF